MSGLFFANKKPAQWRVLNGGYTMPIVREILPDFFELSKHHVVKMFNQASNV